MAYHNPYYGGWGRGGWGWYNQGRFSIRIEEKNDNLSFSSRRVRSLYTFKNNLIHVFVSFSLSLSLSLTGHVVNSKNEKRKNEIVETHTENALQIGETNRYMM